MINTQITFDHSKIRRDKSLFILDLKSKSYDPKILAYHVKQIKKEQKLKNFILRKKHLGTVAWGSEDYKNWDDFMRYLLGERWQ